MRTRSSTIVAAGILVAMLGALTVVAYARSVQGASATGPTVEAWTAATSIDAGTKGADAAKLLKQVSVPEGLVPQGAVTEPESLTGRIAVRPIAAGEVITGSQFGAPASSSGEPVAPASGLQIPPGTNAVTVNMPVPQGVARFVQPGDLVNVYATFKQVDGRQGPITKIILSNVQVLANSTAAQSAAAGRLSATTGDVLLTVALHPHSVEKLVYAKENGSLWFALVHPGDEPVSSGGQTVATVLG